MKSQKNRRLVAIAIMILGLAAIFVENASGAVDSALARSQAAYQPL